ncbi:MAG: hypothetical protein KGK03_03815, partial [Candidatus Omnitrophica bacterium]|nr:hypothetical protein [Candidatus Omnitrophota bacterium]
VAGISIRDPQEKQKIYQRYLQAFKKGVYNYIKEEQDPLTQQMIPRKYFSGGFDFNVTRALQLKEGPPPSWAMVARDRAMLVRSDAVAAGNVTNRYALGHDIRQENVLGPGQEIKASFEGNKVWIQAGDSSYQVLVKEDKVYFSRWDKINGQMQGQLYGPVDFDEEIKAGSSRQNTYQRTESGLEPQHFLFKVLQSTGQSHEIEVRHIGTAGQTKVVYFTKPKFFLNGHKQKTLTFEDEGGQSQTVSFFKNGNSYAVKMGDEVARLNQDDHFQPFKDIFVRVEFNPKDNSFWFENGFHDTPIYVEEPGGQGTEDRGEEAIRKFIKDHDINNQFQEILSQLRDESVSLEDFLVDLNLVDESLEKGRNNGWRSYLNIFMAWKAAIDSSRLIGPVRLELLHGRPSLQSLPGTSNRPKKIFLIRPTSRDMDLIQEWGEEVFFQREWHELIQSKGNVLALVSEDETGKRHLEGWAAYDIFSVFGLYINHIEIAPWHLKKTGNRAWKGIGSLLVAYVINESLRLGYKGQVFAFAGTPQGEDLFKRLGAQWDPGIKSEKYKVLPFYYFNAAAGQAVIKTQNNRHGDLTVEDAAMRSGPGHVQDNNLGGIDLTRSQMNLQVAHSAGQIQFRLDQAMVHQLKNVSGFRPVIINIQPMDDLRRFLGFADNQSPGQRVASL